MNERVLTGTRMRNRRIDLGLKQAYVAKMAGISASYLNLIEHNRRRIGHHLLGELASILQIDVALLEGGTAEAVLSPLREAAVAFPQAAADGAQAEEFVARFPGWAGVVAAQQAQIARLEARVQALSNRLAHDTQIAQSLHEVISTATAIRSTASILAETPDLDADWQARFHGNIDTDSARLAESSQALLGFLDMELDGGGEVATALEQAETVLAAREHQFRGGDAFEDVSDAAARDILLGWAARAGADMAALPEPEFAQAARAVAYDPGRLVARFGVGLDLVLRRLALLEPDEGHPAMGLAVCDAAGVITYQKPLLDFRLPRAQAACPLWPLFQALTQPGRALRRVVRLPGAARTSFECFAVATPAGAITFGQEPRMQATMLVRPAPSSEAPEPVGPGCRLCPIENCDSRRQPAIT